MSTQNLAGSLPVWARLPYVIFSILVLLASLIFFYIYVDSPILFIFFFGEQPADWLVALIGALGLLLGPLLLFLIWKQRHKRLIE